MDGNCMSNEQCMITERVPEILSSLNISLICSTYHTHQVFTFSPSLNQQNIIDVGSTKMSRPMGIGVSPSGDKIAIAGHNFIDTFTRISTEHFLLTNSAITGVVDAHEVRQPEEYPPIFVNTIFNNLSQIKPGQSFNEIWKPKFIRGNQAADKCHINGMAYLEDSKLSFVTMLGNQTDKPLAWKEQKALDGQLWDVNDNSPVLTGLAAPHSPRIVGSDIYFFESGKGLLSKYNLYTETRTEIIKFAGFPRGLAIKNNLAFIGVSKLRENNLFEELEVKKENKERISGIYIVNLLTKSLEGYIKFPETVTEIFDVQFISGRVSLIKDQAVYKIN